MERTITLRTRLTAAAAAVAAIALVSVSLVPGAQASGNSDLPCQVGQISDVVGVAYQFRSDVGTNPFDLIYDADGDPSTTDDQKVIGFATYDSPTDGKITVTITGNFSDDDFNYSYEAAFCVKGATDRVESGWLADGGATDPAVQTPSGNDAGVSNYAYVVRELKERKPFEVEYQWCSPGFWKNNYAAWEPTGFSPTSVDTVTNQTFATILGNPKTYARTGDFERIADILSWSHPDVDYSPQSGRVADSCPLSADEANKA